VASGIDARADALLSGPRGRALCAAAAGLDAHRLLNALARPVSAVTLRSIEEANTGRPGWPPAAWAELSAGDAGTAPTVAEVVAVHVADVDLDALGSTEDPRMLLAVLAEAVNDWTFSDDDIAAAVAFGEAPEALAPVAAALAGAPGAAWWWSPAALGAQRWIAWAAQSGPPPLDGAADALREYSQAEAANEARSADMVPFPPDPQGRRYSGMWWSAPRGAGLAGTTRELPGLPAVQLAICEDSPGNGPVEVWDVGIDSSARAYEVDGPDAWCALTEAFPREVTLSRRHDWWRWTGWEGRWLIPDWAAVADSYDAVHLSVVGHLQASYRALPVAGGACTCIAGWDPDETIWLTDVLARTELAARWENGIGRSLVSG
jgi:hypothetical protein